MSSRAERKRAARETREAAEAKEASEQRRKRLFALAGGAVLLAIVVVVVLIAVSGGEEEESASGGEVVAMFEGIPQDGIALGDPDAPLTLVEYADLQCPFCKEYATDVLPELVDKYVRPGDVRMELNLLTFLGPDSDKLARAAYAASKQDSMWQFVESAFEEQGAENSGYVTDEYIDSLAAGIGLDGPELRKTAAGEPVSQMVADARRASSEAGISSTPSFQIGPTGGSLELLEVRNLDPDEFSEAIDKQLAGAR